MSKGKSVWQKKLELTLSELKEKGQKPSLLLHACCGPCSSYVLEYLSELFEIRVYYYNPNIYPPEEYSRRCNELKEFYTKFPCARNVSFVEADYCPQEFYEAIGIKSQPELADCPEKGERCRRCYALRLKKSYEYAKENGFDYFCTTLSISPFKDAEKINLEGEKLCQENKDGPAWLYSDFKKNGGFKRSLELSSQYCLYRQDYCGCVYSIKNKCLE